MGLSPPRLNRQQPTCVNTPCSKGEAGGQGEKMEDGRQSEGYPRHSQWPEEGPLGGVCRLEFGGCVAGGGRHPTPHSQDGTASCILF